MTDQSVKNRGSLRRALAIAWPVVLVAGLVWAVTTRRDALADLATNARPGLLVVVLALLLGQLLPSVLLWATAARALGSPQATPAVVARVTVRALPARYLPGNVWYALGRATLLTREHEVPATTTALIAGVETALTLLVAAGAGAGLLATAGASSALQGAAAPAVLVTWMAALVVLLSPPVLNRLLALVAQRRNTTVPHLDWPTLLRLAGLMVAHWVWATTTFLVFMAAFPAARPDSLATAAGAYQIGWLTGFLAPFAPQGAGIAEGATALLLGGGAATAVLLGGLRAILLVRDGILVLAERLTRA